MTRSPLIDDDFTLLDMVVDGLHGLGHGIAEGLRGLAVQGERGAMISGENQDQHGAAALRGELFGGAQLLREGREHGGHVTDIRYVGAQGFRLCVHVADDDPVLGGQARRTSPTTPSRKRSSNHGKPVERTYSCTSGLIHWASKSELTGVASFSASEARKASCASGEVSCPLISLSIPKIFCRNAAISVTLRSNTVGWSMAT